MTRCTGEWCPLQAGYDVGACDDYEKCPYRLEIDDTRFVPVVDLKFFRNMLKGIIDDFDALMERDSLSRVDLIGRWAWAKSIYSEKPHRCPRCNHVFKEKSKFCPDCGILLDMDPALFGQQEDE